MSYLLEFPATGTLPPESRSPPYVLFGIQGEDISHELPPRIPLRVVRHLVPKLQQWVLPPPSLPVLPPSVAREALLSPCIGIDMLDENIEALGFAWIVDSMLKCSGEKCPRELFRPQPCILGAVSIYKTWLALDLPMAGIANLITHIHTDLMMGPAVRIQETEAIWDNFPRDSNIVCAMGENFIRSHIQGDYTHGNFVRMREWYLQSDEHHAFFQSLEDRFHMPVEMQESAPETQIDVRKKPASIIMKGPSTINRSAKIWKSAQDTLARVKKMLEKTKAKPKMAREASTRQIIRRLSEEVASGPARLRRTESDESIRSMGTAIWDPPTPSDQRTIRLARGKTKLDNASIEIKSDMIEKEL